MAGVIGAARFIENVRKTSLASKVVVRVEISIETTRVARARVFLIDLTFVDVYYNQKTGATAFAQIHRAKRIFGADNKQGWHWHPREEPSLHVESKHAISFEEFFRDVEKNAK